MSKGLGPLVDADAMLQREQDPGVETLVGEDIDAEVTQHAHRLRDALLQREGRDMLPGVVACQTGGELVRQWVRIFVHGSGEEAQEKERARMVGTVVCCILLNPIYITAADCIVVGCQGEIAAEGFAEAHAATRQVEASVAERGIAIAACV